MGNVIQFTKKNELPTGPDSAGKLEIIKHVCQHILDTQTEAFKLAVPNTNPPVYIVVGRYEECVYLLNKKEDYGK